MNRISAILVQCAVLIVPFVYVTNALDPILLPRLLLLAFVFFVALVLLQINYFSGHRMSDLTFLRAAIFPALLGYLAVGAASLTQTLDIGDGLFDLLRSCLFTIALLTLTWLLVAKRGYLQTLFRTIAVVALCLSIIAVLQYFGLGLRSLPGNVIPYATMANKNLLASFMLLTLPLVLYCWLTSKLVWRYLSLLAIAASMYVIAISQTRAVWLAILTAAAVTLTIAASVRMPGGHKTISALSGIRGIKLLTGALAIGIIASIVTQLSYTADVPVKNAEVAGVLNTTSLKQRLALWDKTLKMYADHPVLGTGLGDWKIEISEYGTDALPSETGAIFFQRPHNDFLWILAETGPVGLGFYISIMIIALYYCLRCIKKASSTEDVRLSLLMIFGLIAFIVVSFFSFPRERIAHMLVVALYMAVTLSICYGARQLEQKFSTKTLMAVFVVINLTLLACVWIGYQRLRTETHARNAIAAKLAGNWSRVISEIDQAESPFSKFDATSTPLIWYRGVADFNLNNIEAACSDFMQAYRENPYHIHVLNNLASCYETEGDHNRAIEYYTKALKIIPNFEETLVNLAAVYYNVQEYKKAYDCLLQVRGEPKDTRYDTFMQKITEKLRDADHN